MTHHILYIAGAFVVSMVCGFLSIPMILSFCKEKNLYDIPNSRKVHTSAVPRLGGVSFMPSMMLAFAIAALVMAASSSQQPISVSLWSAHFIVSFLLMYGVGLVDDLIGLNAPIKFTMQILAAGIIVVAGLYINNLYGLWGIHEVSPLWGYPLTIFIMVFIMNAINLIDGIDGLAASLSFLALGGFLIIFLREQINVYCILIAGMMGVLVPYFYFNVFGKRDKNRKIFMGDSGSLTLGLILGFLFVKFAMYNPYVAAFHLDGLLLPYTLLIVPVFDVARVICVRLRHRRPLFMADKNHIHHKLMQSGLTQHKALVAIIAIALAYIVLNLLLFHLVSVDAIVGIDIAIYIAIHQMINLAIKKKGSSDAQIDVV